MTLKHKNPSLKQNKKLKGKETIEPSKDLKCFKFNEIGHKSNNCLRKKFINMSQQEEEEEEFEEDNIKEE